MKERNPFLPTADSGALVLNITLRTVILVQEM